MDDNSGNTTNINKVDILNSVEEYLRLLLSLDLETERSDKRVEDTVSILEQLVPQSLGDSATTFNIDAFLLDLAKKDKKSSEYYLTLVNTFRRNLRNKSKQEGNVFNIVEDLLNEANVIVHPDNQVNKYFTDAGYAFSVGIKVENQYKYVPDTSLQELFQDTIRLRVAFLMTLIQLRTEKYGVLNDIYLNNGIYSREIALCILFHSLIAISKKNDVDSIIEQYYRIKKFVIKDIKRGRLQLPDRRLFKVNSPTKKRQLYKDLKRYFLNEKDFSENDLLRILVAFKQNYERLANHVFPVIIVRDPITGKILKVGMTKFGVTAKELQEADIPKLNMLNGDVESLIRFQLAQKLSDNRDVPVEIAVENILKQKSLDSESTIKTVSDTVKTSIFENEKLSRRLLFWMPNYTEDKTVFGNLISNVVSSTLLPTTIKENVEKYSNVSGPTIFATLIGLAFGGIPGAVLIGAGAAGVSYFTKKENPENSIAKGYLNSFFDYSNLVNSHIVTSDEAVIAMRNGYTPIDPGTFELSRATLRKLPDLMIPTVGSLDRLNPYFTRRPNANPIDEIFTENELTEVQRTLLNQLRNIGLPNAKISDVIGILTTTGLLNIKDYEVNKSDKLLQEEIAKYWRADEQIEKREKLKDLKTNDKLRVYLNSLFDKFTKQERENILYALNIKNINQASDSELLSAVRNFRDYAFNLDSSSQQAKNIANTINSLDDEKKLLFTGFLKLGFNAIGSSTYYKNTPFDVLNTTASHIQVSDSKNINKNRANARKAFDNFFLNLDNKTRQNFLKLTGLKNLDSQDLVSINDADLFSIVGFLYKLNSLSYSPEEFKATDLGIFISSLNNQEKKYLYDFLKTGVRNINRRLFFVDTPFEILITDLGIKQNVAFNAYDSFMLSLYPKERADFYSLVGFTRKDFEGLSADGVNPYLQLLRLMLLEDKTLLAKFRNIFESSDDRPALIANLNRYGIKIADLFAFNLSGIASLLNFLEIKFGIKTSTISWIRRSRESLENIRNMTQSGFNSIKRREALELLFMVFKYDNVFGLKRSLFGDRMLRELTQHTEKKSGLMAIGEKLTPYLSTTMSGNAAYSWFGRWLQLFSYKVSRGVSDYVKRNAESTVKRIANTTGNFASRFSAEVFTFGGRFEINKTTRNLVAISGGTLIVGMLSFNSIFGIFGAVRTAYGGIGGSNNGASQLGGGNASFAAFCPLQGQIVCNQGPKGGDFPDPETGIYGPSYHKIVYYQTPAIKAIDLFPLTDENVYSIEGGKLYIGGSACGKGGGGYTAILEGSSGVNYQYIHLINVVPGDNGRPTSPSNKATVTMGQKIGNMFPGKSRCSTGTHLHIDMANINPLARVIDKNQWNCNLPKRPDGNYCEIGDTFER